MYNVKEIFMYNQFYFIYSIVNTENNKRYIGYTNDLNRRLYDHMTQLELNQHPNLKNATRV